jgi:hypothetical protein
MPTQQDVSKHYTHGDLVTAIRSGIESLGKKINSVTVDDLAPVDEFHIGGRQASYLPWIREWMAIEVRIR